MKEENRILERDKQTLCHQKTAQWGQEDNFIFRGVKVWLAWQWNTFDCFSFNFGCLDSSFEDKYGDSFFWHIQFDEGKFFFERWYEHDIATDADMGDDIMLTEREKDEIKKRLLIAMGKHPFVAHS